MKPILKRALLIVMIGVFALGSSALMIWLNLRTTQQAAKYELAGEGLRLKKYHGSSEKTRLEIPDEAEGTDGNMLPVTALGEFSISNASYLEELVIGANVENIHPWAVTNCEALRAIEVDPANQHFVSADGVLYTKDMTKLVLFPNKNTETLVIPEGVAVIGENAFYKCKSLLKITFPKSLRELEEKALFRCAGLKELKLPEGLEVIGVDAFAFCDGLEGEVHIPASCTEIKPYAFSSIDSKIDKIVILADKSKITIPDDKNWLPMKEKKANALVDFEFAKNKTN